MDESARAPSFALVVSVRCLECGTLYAKPADGGTLAANPGCPECGDLGWLPASTPFARARPRSPRSRSAPRSAS